MGKLLDKVIPFDQLEDWRRSLTGKLVVTNGCFDILHAGHVSCLEEAKEYGDTLMVGLNSDESACALKGPSRPVNTGQNRALVLCGLRSVDYVCIFNSITAVEFLDKSRPDVWIKGGNYSFETLNHDELIAVSHCGGSTVIIPAMPGISTSLILKSLNDKAQ